MVSIGTKLAAVCAGALTYWLCVPAETPVVDDRACCATASWAKLASVRPGRPRSRSFALVSRGTAPHSWTVAGPGGKPAFGFTLPAPVDRALGGEPSSDDQAASYSESETVDWVFHRPGGSGPEWTFPGRRPCRHGDEHPWCKKGRPPVVSVPEPGSWALMLAGLAILGAALRVGRRAAPTSGC